MRSLIHFRKKIPGLDLVAEDLGLLRPEVLMLKDHYHLKGMKILIFSIETGGKYARDTFHDVENMIFYTGTRDNDTIMQWYGKMKCCSQKKNPPDVKEGGSITGLCQGQIPAVHHAESGRICDHSAGRYSRNWKRGTYQHTGNHWSPNWEWHLPDFIQAKKELQKFGRLIVDTKR